MTPDDAGPEPETHAAVLLVAPAEKTVLSWRAELDRQGFVVTVESTAPAAIANARESGIALIVIDASDAGTGGLEFIRTLRDEGNPATILVITPNEDMTAAFEYVEAGADACAGQGCTPRELAARLRALMRRHHGDSLAPTRPWTIGDLRVDPAARSAFRNGKRLSLSPREFAILLALLRRRGRVVSRDELLQDVWRGQKRPIGHTVEALVFGLRRKLGYDETLPYYIHTVRRSGYMIM